MTRQYVQKRRAERAGETRRRIVEAAVAAHAEHGPARSAINDIAERADVDRVTIYRHFPDQGALLQACSEHFYSAHPVPDPSAWTTIAEPEARLRTGLSEIYAYYRAHAPMVAHVLRDAEELAHLGVGRRLLALQADATDVIAEGWSLPARQRAHLRASVRVAVDFATWRTLTHNGGLTDKGSVALAASWVERLAADG